MLDKLRALHRDVVLLGDANASFGSSCSLAVGVQSPEGELLHGTLLEQALWILHAFWDKAANDFGYTCKSAAGDLCCRSDYVDIRLS